MRRARESVHKRIYEGAPDARELIVRHGIDYIVVVGAMSATM